MDFKQKFSELKTKVLPFEDDYFKGLSYEQIAELAKKSVRLTADNIELQDSLEDMNAKIEELTYKYNCAAKQYNHLLNHLETIRDLAQRNADAYEYCLKGLEDKVDGLTTQNEILKGKLNNVKKLMEKYENEFNKKGTTDFTDAGITS